MQVLGNKGPCALNLGLQVCIIVSFLKTCSYEGIPVLLFVVYSLGWTIFTPEYFSISAICTLLTQCKHFSRSASIQKTLTKLTLSNKKHVPLNQGLQCVLLWPTLQLSHLSWGLTWSAWILTYGFLFCLSWSSASPQFSYGVVVGLAPSLIKPGALLLLPKKRSGFGINNLCYSEPNLHLEKVDHFFRKLQVMAFGNLLFWFSFWIITYWELSPISKKW